MTDELPDFLTRDVYSLQSRLGISALLRPQKGVNVLADISSLHLSDFEFFYLAIDLPSHFHAPQCSDCVESSCAIMFPHHVLRWAISARTYQYVTVARRRGRKCHFHSLSSTRPAKRSSLMAQRLDDKRYKLHSETRSAYELRQHVAKTH